MSLSVPGLFPLQCPPGPSLLQMEVFNSFLRGYMLFHYTYHFIYLFIQPSTDT
jgi:hypothetical protein